MPHSSANIDSVSGDTIAVQVGKGPTGELFHVHKTLICASSKFFENVTKPEWQPASPEKPKPVDLTDERPKVFKFFVQWLYKGVVILEDPQAPGTSDFLAQSYVLGEKIMAEAFQDDILKLMIDRSSDGQLPGVAAIRRIYEGTTSGSPARRLVVDIWAWGLRPKWEAENKDLLEDTCAEFVVDLVWAIIKVRPMPDRAFRPWLKNPDAYLISSKEDLDESSQARNAA